MKKILTILLAMLLSLTVAATLMTGASAVDEERPSYGDINSEYTTGTWGAKGTEIKNELDFFDATNSYLWVKATEDTLITPGDGTATIVPASTTGHAFKNFSANYGTFLFNFQVDISEGVDPGKFVTDPEENSNMAPTFFGFIFNQAVGDIGSFNGIQTPWGTHGGYPYMITFDCERGSDPREGYENREWQTGLTLRRYPRGGSHNYTRWSTVRPDEKTYLASDLGRYYDSKMPAYAKEVRAEDIWDGQAHILTCEFLPLYTASIDGIDAMLIEIYFDGELVLRVYDEQPFTDIEQPEPIEIDKRKTDGYVTFFTHNTFQASAAADSKDYEVKVNEFKIVNYGSWADKDPSTLPTVSGFTFNNPPAVRYRSGVSNELGVTFINPAERDEYIVNYYNEDGDLIGENRTPPSYSDAGVYNVSAYVARKGFSPTTVSASLTIQKADVSLRGSTNIRVDYDGEEHKIEPTLSITNSDLVLRYSPQQGYTEEGMYKIIVSAPATKNYNAIAPKEYTLTIGSVTPPDQQGELNKSDFTFESATVTYDGLEHCIWATCNSTDEKIKNNTVITYSGNTGNIDAGEYTIRATVSCEGYESLELDPVTLTITPKTVEITAEEEQTFYYCNQAFTASGYVAGTDLTVVASQAVTNINETGYSITLSCVDPAGNYIVTPKTIIVKIIAK